MCILLEAFIQILVGDVFVNLSYFDLGKFHNKYKFHGFVFFKPLMFNVISPPQKEYFKNIIESHSFAHDDECRCILKILFKWEK